MDGLNIWVYPTTMVGEAIKIRPLVLKSFYARDINPWTQLESSLTALCERNGVEVSGFLGELESLPVPDPESDWESLPSFHIIDFLTLEHARFLQRDLPAILYMMKIAGEAALICEMDNSLQEFTERLRTHVSAEEDGIFPSILRNDFAARYPGVAGSFQPGIRAASAAARLLEKEDEFRFTLDLWIERASNATRGKEITAPVLAVVRLVRKLERDIVDHTRLEQETLFRLASRTEETLKAPPILA